MVDARERSLTLLLKDLQLMVFSRGRQRTVADFEVLFDKAGARLVRHAPTGSGDVLMEVRAGTARP